MATPFEVELSIPAEHEFIVLDLTPDENIKATEILSINHDFNNDIIFTDQGRHL